MVHSLHTNVLPKNQLELFDSLSTQSFIGDFYLAGGTGLALQIGHRQSLDFDFFIPRDFKTPDIIKVLVRLGSYERDNEEMNTVNGTLNKVRISFFGYKYRILDEFRMHNNIRIAGLRDISAMKLEAIAGRGSKKDFIDMFFLLKHFTIEEIFDFHKDKYGIGLNNQYHHLKSLVYFADAEHEAMPVMIKPLYWSDVKKEIVSCVRGFKLL